MRLYEFASAGATASGGIAAAPVGQGEAYGVGTQPKKKKKKSDNKGIYANSSKMEEVSSTILRR